VDFDYKILGARVREIRRMHGFSQEQLAEKAGLSAVYIGYIENAKKQASLSSLIKISDAMEVGIDELLLGNIPAKSTDYYNEFTVLLESCNIREKQIIYEISKATKKILELHNLT